MSLIVLALAETVKLYLCLVVGNRGILSDTDFVAFLLNPVEKAKDIAVRLEGIKFGLVSYFALDVFVAEPQDSGEHLA